MDHKPQKEGIEELMCLVVKPTILLEFILVTGNRNCVIRVAGRKPEEFRLAWEGQLVRQVGDFLLGVLIVQKNYLIEQKKDPFTHLYPSPKILHE